MGLAFDNNVVIRGYAEAGELMPAGWLSGPMEGLLPALPSRNRKARAMPRAAIVALSIATSCACAAQAADAQTPAGQPYYADGEIHCPDGKSAIFKSNGEPPTDDAMRLACAFDTGEQSAAAKAIHDGMEAMKSAPLSPNGLPMEAEWERAPGAPNGEFTDARPYFVSHWGGIVIRGRRNGNVIDRALGARHCGASDNPATDIYFIGEAPANICEGVSEVAAGQVRSVNSAITIKGVEDEYTKVGTPRGWAVLVFKQNIAGVVHSGADPATGETASQWGTSPFGAFFQNEGGKHVFYAPGETVKFSDNFSFVVEPVMDADEISAMAMGAALKSIGNDPVLKGIGQPKPKTPWQWAFLVVFGVPLALIGGVIYGIWRLLRRRRGALPTHAGRAAAPDTVVPVSAGPAGAGTGVEEFFGLSRTSANFRRKGWTALLVFAGPGLFFFSMLWWGEPAIVTNWLELLLHFVVSKVLPLGLIAFGIAGFVYCFRLGSKPETEVLWYRLDRAGLHILHDAARRVTPSEFIPATDGSGEPGGLIAWSAMRSLVVVSGARPKVKIVRRSPGAVIDRTLVLAAGQRSRDGALFEDRVSRWYATMKADQAAVPTTGAVQGEAG